MDCLTIGNGPPIGDPLLRPLYGHLQCPRQDADCHRSPQKAVVVDQPFLPQAESLSDLSQNFSLGDPHVIQMDVVLLSPGRTGPYSNRLEAHPFRGIVQDEHGNAAPLTPFGVGHRLQQNKVGGRCAGNEHLGAVQHPIVPVADCPRLHHAAWVRAGLGLGLAEGIVQVPLNRRVQVLLLLLRGARSDHHHGHG